MKTFSFTNTLKPGILAMVLLLLGLFWSGKAEACSAKAGFVLKNSANGKVAFTNTSSTTSGTFRSIWDFNDKSSSTDKSPTHTFAANGIYHICLTVIDSADTTCKSSFCFYDTVMTYSCTANIISVSSKLAVAFSDSGSTGIAHKHLATWNFGDGSSTVTGDNTKHTYSKGGTYSACLTVYDSTTGCSAKNCTSITVTNCNLTASFIDSAGFGYNFKFYGTTNASSHNTIKWKFGDGGNDSGKSHLKESHTYSSTSGAIYYNVEMDVYDSTTGCFLAVVNKVYMPSCSANISDVVSKFSAAFSDSGSSAMAHAHSAVWDFGDGSSKVTGDRPTHTYAKTGTYNACVTVYDSSTGCSNQNCKRVTISSCSLVSSFKYSQSGRTVSFTSTSNITTKHASYKWYFGDGSNDSTSGTSVSHTYGSSVSSATVYLLVYDSTTGCSSASSQSLILCNAVSDFTYTKSTLTATFKADTSLHGKTNITYSWDFGDKSSPGTTADPSHTYSANGTYHVCLTVTDVSAKCYNTTCTDVTVSSCTANFVYAASNLTVGFSDSGSSALADKHSASWDFGDGNNGTGDHTSHTYGKNGTYTACVTVYDSITGCSAKTCKSITIGTCSLTVSYTDSIFGHTVKFYGTTNASKHFRYKWYFGPNELDSTSGLNPTYTYGPTINNTSIYLLIYDSTTGCTQYATGTITLPCGANPYFTYTGTKLSVAFSAPSSNTASVKYSWNFGDSSAKSDSKTPTHVFATSGTYTVCLTTTDTAAKCVASNCEKVSVTNACSLSVAFNDSTSGHSVIFTGKTNASKHSRIVWAFGDGSFDSISGLATTHTYGSLVTHATVTLSIYDSTTKCLTSESKALSFCLALSDYTYTVNGLSVSFKGDANNLTGAKYQWDFNDKSGATTFDPTHTFSASGTYNVCLTVTDSSCSTTTCHSITVASCNLTASFTDSIDNHKVKFAGKTNGSSHLQITWIFGDGTSDSTSGLNVTHTYASTVAGATVYLKVYDSATKCITYYDTKITLSYCISGTVLLGKTGAYPATVYLITYNSKDSSLKAIDSTKTDSAGEYQFCGLSNGTYYTKAALGTGNSFYKDYIPTYHNDATTWAKALKVTVSNASVSSVNISMKKGTNPGGAGFIGGKIKSGANKKGDAVPNILVVLYDSSGNPVAYTYSNATGDYSFAGISFGTYDVYGEVLGYASTPAIVTITDTSPTNDVTDLQVNTVLNTVTASIKPIGAWDIEKADVYPNPVINKLTLSLSPRNASEVSVKIYDITGKVVSELNTSVGGGAQKMEVDASGLPAGIYFLRMEMPKDNTLMEAQFIKAR